MGTPPENSSQESPRDNDTTSSAAHKSPQDPGRTASWRARFEWLQSPWSIGIGSAVIAGLVLYVIFGIIHVFGSRGASSSYHPATSSIPSATASASPGRIGKPVGAKPIDLLSYYPQRGFMGDIGDITDEEPGNNLIRMTYEAEGRGPHEWEYEYIDGKINPKPCGFAGIMLLDGVWGQTPGAGYDLRGFTTISWEARSLSGNVFVKFVAGGANWVWSEKRTIVPAPYPDSLPNLQLGEKELTGQWRHFEFSFGKNTTAKGLQAVVAPFGWIISLGSNQGNHGQPAKFVIEVRNISYG